MIHVLILARDPNGVLPDVGIWDIRFDDGGGIETGIPEQVMIQLIRAEMPIMQITQEGNPQ